MRSNFQSGIQNENTLTDCGNKLETQIQIEIVNTNLN